jgi:hypothetical protein
MAEIIEIYGTKIKLPEVPPKEEILYAGRPRKEQKWKREALPEYFETVEYDKAGNLILTDQQEEYASREVKRLKEGVTAMIGGRARFLPKRYYFFLQYYTLEDGTAPDFREADRLYYLFFEYWFLILWCLGIIRTKKRRQGASSQSCSNLLYEAIFYKNSNCGLISKTKDDSKATFTEMVTNAYQQLPVFLKPRQVNKEDSVTELIFSHKVQSTKGGQAAAIATEKGNNSKINYKAPVLNAYDRGRMSYVLGDEFGKLPGETPASRLLSIISKTLVKGVKRVGWIDLPSTTNEMLKGGGMEYYRIWKAADQFKRKPTINRIVRFFQPAYEAYEGFIDEFGDSVVDAPTEEQYEYLVKKWVVRDEETGDLVSELSEDDIRLGAKRYIMVKRREGLEGMDLEEEMRMNPCNEDEAFMSAASDCAFNSINIKKRQKELEEKPVYRRKVSFYRDLDQKIRFRDVDDTDTFHWEITQFPKAGEENKKTVIEGIERPGRTSDGAIAVDSYTNTQSGKYGSKASAWIGRKFDMLNPEETGRPIGWLYGRPKEKAKLHEQVMLAAQYFGYKVWYEKIADDYYSYFKERGKLSYLGRYPNRLIAPDKRLEEQKPRDYGTPLDEFSLTKQLEDGVSYFEYHCDKIDFIELLDEALQFEPHNRTEYDTVVSFLILVSCLMEVEKAPPPQTTPLIKTYPAIANSQNN